MNHDPALLAKMQELDEYLGEFEANGPTETEQPLTFYLLRMLREEIHDRIRTMQQESKGRAGTSKPASKCS